jgi:hypothetical protein
MGQRTKPLAAVEHCAQGKSTIRPSLRSASDVMTVLPKPRRSDGDTGGPLRSVQHMVKQAFSACHRTSTWPVSVDSAPYLPASARKSHAGSPAAGLKVAGS